MPQLIKKNPCINPYTKLELTRKISLKFTSKRGKKFVLAVLTQSCNVSLANELNMTLGIQRLTYTFALKSGKPPLIIVTSMWFWSVPWPTNCPVNFSFFLVGQKKLTRLRDRTNFFVHSLDSFCPV